MKGYPILSQVSPDIASMPLGYGTGTVGQYGCLYTAMLMMVCRGVPFEKSYYEAFMSCLKANGNYTPASGNYLASANISHCRPSYWGKCELVYESASFPGLPPLIEMNKLFAWVSGGKSALMCVDSNLSQAGLQEHWILLTAGDQDEYDPKANLLAHDPYSGKEVSVASQFGGSVGLACYRFRLYDCPEAILNTLPNPPTPPVPTPTPTDVITVVPTIGVNNINQGDTARAALRAGTQFLSMTFNSDAVPVLQNEFPNAQFGVRGNMNFMAWSEIDRTMSQAFNSSHPKRKEWIFYGQNEDDRGFSSATVEGIKKRSDFDKDNFHRFQDMGCLYAGGGFAHGTPNVWSDKAIRDAMSQYYAPLFNAGMLFNQHLYGKILSNNIPLRDRIFHTNYNDATIDGITFPVRETYFLEERTKFYVALCGFDCNKSYFVSDEFGVDDRGGFKNPNNYTTQEFIAYIKQFKKLHSEPVMVNGKLKSYRLKKAAVFQIGDPVRWAGYNCLDWFSDSNVVAQINS